MNIKAKKKKKKKKKKNVTHAHMMIFLKVNKYLIELHQVQL